MPSPTTSKFSLSIFAICAPGLEQILISELKELGVGRTEATEGGVAFNGDLALLYKANLWLRTASRVIVRVARFHADSFHELERRAKQIPWDGYVAKGARVQFRVTCRKSRLYHSDAVAERLAESIVKRVGDVNVGKPEVKRSDEEEQQVAVDARSQLFIARLDHDECTISADSSGALLHRRGYREASGKAPLRETLAAAMVLSSGWDRRSPLVDPFCGSGTIAIEAALIARRIAPGLRRDFAFHSWPTSDERVWTALKTVANESSKNGSIGALLASDRDDGVVELARENSTRASVSDDIQFQSKPISAIELPPGPAFIVTNPPYGIRVGERGALRNLYAQFGNVLRKKARGCTVMLLSADKTLDKMVGIQLSEILRTRNGGIPVRFVKGRVEP
ncbi:MAG: class I SAM-dependent RNA methyltransferase [Gemmatimonadaceae bacterium]